jgi:hypothetical protein
VKEFELADANAKPRVSIKPDGEAVFRMMDKTGTIRVKIASDDDGSGLVLLMNPPNQQFMHWQKKMEANLSCAISMGKRESSLPIESLHHQRFQSVIFLEVCSG